MISTDWQGLPNPGGGGKRVTSTPKQPHPQKKWIGGAASSDLAATPLNKHVEVVCHRKTAQKRRSASRGLGVEGGKG
jgi:hypothetical protein